LALEVFFLGTAMAGRCFLVRGPGGARRVSARV
jgi:hypothetical protein